MQKQNKNNNCRNGNSSSCGKSLNLLAASAANLIAGSMTDLEISLLALFFSTLGDALGTIVAANELCKSENDITPEQEILL